MKRMNFLVVGILFARRFTKPLQSSSPSTVMTMCYSFCTWQIGIRRRMKPYLQWKDVLFLHIHDDLIRHPQTSQGNKRRKKNRNQLKFFFANYFWHDDRRLMWNLTPFSNSTVPPTHTLAAIHRQLKRNEFEERSWRRYSIGEIHRSLINTIDANNNWPRTIFGGFFQEILH